MTQAFGDGFSFFFLTALFLTSHFKNLPYRLISSLVTSSSVSMSPSLHILPFSFILFLADFSFVTIPLLFIHAFPSAAALNAITLLFCSSSQPVEGPLLFLTAHPTGQPFLSGPPRCLTEDLWCGAGHPRMGVGDGEKTPRLLPLLLADRVLGPGEVMVTEGSLAPLAQGAAFW